MAAANGSKTPEDQLRARFEQAEAGTARASGSRPRRS
jgi:hypothetical protein